jgi:hypothetical protein
MDHEEHFSGYFNSSDHMFTNDINDLYNLDKFSGKLKLK